MSAKTTTSTIKHAPHTQATLLERINHIVYFGGESYFTEAEAEVVIAYLVKRFSHVTAVHRNPSTGFVRLSADNVKCTTPRPQVEHINQ